MANKTIQNEKTQDKLILGVEKTVNAIKTTLGPSGKCVAIQGGEYPDITRDGATVAKSIILKDPIENMGAQIVKKAAQSTEEQAGDGPQPLYAKVLTPNGWTTMGELKIGDKICGTNGTIQEVVGIFNKGQKEIYKVHFSNRGIVDCCEDQLWTVTNLSGKEKTIPLKDIFAKPLFRSDNNQARYFTPRTFVEFEKKDALIDPYLLGLLLGDGTLCESGSIELSLGYKKAGVLENIILPENIQYNVQDVKEKNYLRVKFSKINKEGPSMHDYIKALGLLNKKSHDKFIPKNYLYTTRENREKLLAGLTNTDGYINSKGLLEYSTASKQLRDDIIELMYSLGKAVHSYEKNGLSCGSYSKDSVIYRISELVGYKYGNKLVGIEKTGEFTEMMCIKVSNPDNLYITDNYVVTHNTSSTSILIQEMVKKGQRYLNSGANVNEIKDGMEAAGKWVSEYIKNHSDKVEGDLEKIKQVATISANNDPEIGGLISECMEKVGINGVITADMSYSLDTSIEVINGMKIERGWASPHFITEKESAQCVMSNPYILVVGEKISSVGQLIPILEPMVQSGRPFVIICDDMDEVVLSTLVLNTLQGACRCCVLKGIEFGENRGPVMQDIATATGATYITPEIGLSVTDATLEMLGSAKKVSIGKYTSIIFEGTGDEDMINERIETIKARLEDKNLSKYDRGRWEKRLANLSGGIGVIHAGGASEVERVNKKATVEDAILASKSAISEGVVPGGGYTFLWASEEGRKELFKKGNKWTEDEIVGIQIVLDSLRSITWNVCNNAGISGDEVISKLLSSKKGKGFNAKTKKYSDLIKDGILDSAKVLRVSLENSISAASMILLTDCAITDEVEEETICKI